MPVFLCRWPNGDISFVSARNKTDAIYYLDEFANAEGADMFQLRHFMLDFKLQDDGTWVLNQWGEDTENEVMRKAYPELDKALTSDEVVGLPADSPEYEAFVQRAVAAERQRLAHKKKKVKEPKTHVGKQLKQMMDAPTAVADRIVENTGKEILKKHRQRGPVH